MFPTPIIAVDALSRKLAIRVVPPRQEDGTYHIEDEGEESAFWRVRQEETRRMEVSNRQVKGRLVR